MFRAMRKYAVWSSTAIHSAIVGDGDRFENNW